LHVVWIETAILDFLSDIDVINHTGDTIEFFHRNTVLNTVLLLFLLIPNNYLLAAILTTNQILSLTFNLNN